MKQKRSEQQIRPLTPKEKAALDYIEAYVLKNNVSPSFSEIKDYFGFASFNSVQRYLQQLEIKGYIHNPGGNQKRAIQVLHSSSVLTSRLESKKQASMMSSLNSQPTPRAGTITSLPVPLLGQVAAGLPIEAHTFDETIDAPMVLLRKPEMTFALKVKGDSMVEDGIFDGDVVLVQQQSHARSGEIVVAVIENEATVKRIYWPSATADSSKKRTSNQLKLTSTFNLPQDTRVELRPANSSMVSMWYQPEQIEIRGVVVGLMRKY